MPTIVPDYVLTVERSRLGNFFLLFSRFEFALKASGYAKAGKWGAEVNWEQFSNDASTKLFSKNDQQLAGAIAYLEHESPKQQKFRSDSLAWEPRPAPKSYSRMRGLIFYVQGVRNNLMHGAKFLAKETADPQRDIKLLEAAEIIISACLECCPNLYRAFDSEVP